MRQFFIKMWIWVTFQYGSIISSCIISSLIELLGIDKNEIDLSIGKNCDDERCVIIQVHRIDEFIIKILVSETTIKLYPIRLDTTGLQENKSIDLDMEVISLATDVTSVYLPMIDVCVAAIQYLRRFIQTRVV